MSSPLCIARQLIPVTQTNDGRREQTLPRKMFIIDTTNLGQTFLSDNGKNLLKVVDSGSKFAYSYFLKAKTVEEIEACLE